MSSILTRMRIVWIAPVLLAAAAAGLSSQALAAPAGQAGQSSCPGQQFSDVCPGDWFYQYVTDLSGLGAISGYGDGTFRPNNTLTRGQAVKVIVAGMGLTASMPETP